MSAEVTAECLGDEWKGYVFIIVFLFYHHKHQRHYMTLQANYQKRGVIKIVPPMMRN